METKVKKNRISEKQIKKLQNNLQMNRTLLGYYFWTELIKEALKINLITEIVISDLEEKVAKSFNTTFQRVCRGLRTSIDSLGEKQIQEYFNVKYKITIKSMLFLCLDYLKTNYLKN